jgi:hypothetical protein
MKHLNVITFNFDNDNESETKRRETYEGVQVFFFFCETKASKLK